MKFFKIISLLSLILVFNAISFSQNDSVPSEEIKRTVVTDAVTYYKKRPSFFDVAWAPIGLSLISVDLMRDSAKYGLQTLIRQPFNGYTNHIDDYIQYAPIVIMYTADLFKVPG